MVIGIFGESCTGKSTLAERLKGMLNAEVYAGKDYLRFAKNENMAKKLFRKELEAAVSGKHIIYVISEPEHLTLLPVGKGLLLAIQFTGGADVMHPRHHTTEQHPRRHQKSRPPEL